MSRQRVELLDAALGAADLFAQTVEVNPLVLADDALKREAEIISARSYEFYQRIGAAEFA